MSADFNIPSSAFFEYIYFYAIVVAVSSTALFLMLDKKIVIKMRTYADGENFHVSVE